MKIVIACGPKAALERHGAQRRPGSGSGPAAAPDRLCVLLFLSSHSPEAAEAELERCAAKGHRGVIVDVFDLDATEEKLMRSPLLEEKVATVELTQPPQRQGSDLDVANAGPFFASELSGQVTGTVLPSTAAPWPARLSGRPSWPIAIPRPTSGGGPELGFHLVLSFGRNVRSVSELGCP